MKITLWKIILGVVVLVIQVTNGRLYIPTTAFNLAWDATQLFNWWFAAWLIYRGFKPAPKQKNAWTPVEGE